MLRDVSETVPSSQRCPVVAVVVTYRSALDFEACLASLAPQLDDGDCVVVLDNASPDRSAETVEAALRTHIRPAGRWRFIRSDLNLGFGRACNLAAASFPEHDVLLLNPDAVLQPESIATLCHALAADSTRGAAGPRIERFDGAPEPGCRRSLPRPGVAVGRLLGLDRIAPSWFGSYNRLGQDPMVPADIEAGSGCCALIRRTAWEQVGGFDPDFFMYGEDLDLFLRLGRAGWTTRYVPTALALHRKGASTDHARDRMLFEFHRAMWLYYRKHHLRSPAALLAPLVVAGLAARFTLLVLLERLRRTRRMIDRRAVAIGGPG
jgi:GT2 family glycosyltransferase